MRSAGGRRWGIGLRDRVTLTFGLLALVLSGLLAVVVGVLVSHYLLDQRQTSAVYETSLNASILRQALAQDRSDVADVLSGVPGNDRTSSLLTFDGAWYTTAVTAGPGALPAELVDLVRAGRPASQRIEVGGAPFLAVGMPVGEHSRDAYFELFSLAQLNSTFHVLSVTLVVAAVVTAAVGLVVGRFASRRALRPLTDLTIAAAAVAGGDLHARLVTDRHDPDLGRLAASFNRTAAALERRVQADIRFAGDVSHELRTPLTTMLNSMALVQNRRAELPPDLVEPIDLLADDLDRFRRLVIDLLEISRDADTADGVDRETANIGDLVRHAADAVAGRPVTTVDDDAVRATLMVDKRRLERVVANLVANADTHGGGCIGVRVHRTQTGVAIVVDDAGPGVAPQHRERIFERFGRGRSGGDERGVGLGLAIVERHVRWHHGTVTVVGRPGGGARFVVELPGPGAG